MIKKIARALKKILYDLALKEKSPKKLTLSCCLGIYIAFSPWVGFHTIMIFVFAWLFRLNPAVTFTSTYILNNPWTMTPLYFADYVFGDFVLKSWFGIDSMAINPVWMTWFNKNLTHYTGFNGFSFWAFMIGGNLLGIILSVILYPILLSFFKKIINKSATNKQNENNCTEQKSLS